jgi:hypothetical protein
MSESINSKLWVLQLMDYTFLGSINSHCNFWAKILENITQKNAPKRRCYNPIIENIMHPSLVPKKKNKENIMQKKGKHPDSKTIGICCNRDSSIRNLTYSKTKFSPLQPSCQYNFPYLK